MRDLKFAVIGYGTIARYIAKAAAQDPALMLVQVIARPGREDAAEAALGRGVEAITDVEDLLQAVSVVLDCAGHEGLRVHGPAVLESGRDLITVSNGALADSETLVQLEAAAANGMSQLEILSGAIGGIDALSAARAGGLTRVTYQGRKPPGGWKGSPAEEKCDLDNLDAPFEHFRGTARDAALVYPKNANVAATVALAGLGMERTEVSLIADPDVQENIHRIEATGTFGRFQFEIAGNPLPDNPKSSALTAMSALRALKNSVALITDAGGGVA